jgi:hypothetical protein
MKKDQKHKEASTVKTINMSKAGMPGTLSLVFLSSIPISG